MQTLTVEGMSCGHCVGVVTEAVTNVDPTANVSVDLKSGKIDIDSDVSQEHFTTAIETAGYRVVYRDADMVR